MGHTIPMGWDSGMGLCASCPECFTHYKLSLKFLEILFFTLLIVLPSFSNYKRSTAKMTSQLNINPMTSFFSSKDMGRNCVKNH
jgi:hypothetical protein